MHYKETVIYVGFSSATKLQYEFSKSNKIIIKRDVDLAFKDMGGYFDIDFGFIDGHYDHSVYNY
ncbi:hypothetical protein SAMN04488142_1422 [Halomonas sp. hl-4]|nr:hypothetical protein SAMN04488142_1422 [Halomonas sp. hl-4]